MYQRMGAQVMEQRRASIMDIKYYLLLACIFFQLWVQAETYTKDQALSDLAFVYTTIQENHPGYYDKENPGFKKNLISNYKKYQKQIKAAQDCGNLKDIIVRFFASFDDSHTRIFFADRVSTPVATETTKHVFAVEHIDAATTWVTLPTFAISAQKIKKQFDAVVQQMKNLRNKKRIVFDLRHNQGGDSSFGSTLLQALLGSHYYNQQKKAYEKNIYVEWRASKDNLHHVQGLYDRNKALDADTAWLKKVYDGMRESLTKNNLFYKEAYADECPARDQSRYSNPIKAQIIVVTDNMCVSACLDFIDELKALDKSVILMGETTDKDSVYMDVRDIELPSKKGHFIFPIKVYRNRPRKNNQPYYPDVVVKDVKNKSRDFLLREIK